MSRLNNGVFIGSDNFIDLRVSADEPCKIYNKPEAEVRQKKFQTIFKKAKDCPMKKNTGCVPEENHFCRQCCQKLGYRQKHPASACALQAIYDASTSGEACINDPIGLWADPLETIAEKLAIISNSNGKRMNSAAFETPEVSADITRSSGSTKFLSPVGDKPSIFDQTLEEIREGEAPVILVLADCLLDLSERPKSDLCEESNFMKSFVEEYVKKWKKLIYEASLVNKVLVHQPMGLGKSDLTKLRTNDPYIISKVKQSNRVFAETTKMVHYLAGKLPAWVRTVDGPTRQQAKIDVFYGVLKAPIIDKTTPGFEKKSPFDSGNGAHLNKAGYLRISKNLFELLKPVFNVRFPNKFH